MASYSADILYGKGAPCEALTSGSSYNFALTSSISGSTYFTFETIRNDNGFYDSSSSTNAVGTFTSLSNVQTLVSSSYIFSFVVEEGGGSFVFTPNDNVAASGSFLRTTGDTSLTIA